MTFISPAQVGLEESDRAGFQFDSVDTLLQTPSPIDWVIKGYLPSKTLFMTFGNPESGKSLLSLDMALHIVLGLPWCGKKVKQGAVFYLAGEGHYGLSRRVKAFTEHHQIDLTGKPLFFSRSATALLDPGSAEEVALAIQETSKEHAVEPIVILVDTLAANYGPGDENSNSDMQLFVNNAQHFLVESAGAAVGLIHHTGHGDKTRGRGASSLQAAIRLEFEITKQDAIVRMKPTKSNEFLKPEPLAFQIESMELPWKEEDGEFSSGPLILPIDYSSPKRRTINLGKNQKQALRILERLLEEQQRRLLAADHDPKSAQVLVSDWRKGCSDAGMDRRRFLDIVNGLTAKSLISIDGIHVLLV